MKFAATIKTLAAWTVTIINPYTAIVWRKGGEQGVPLPIAVALLLINVALIGVITLILLVWLLSKFA